MAFGLWALLLIVAANGLALLVSLVSNNAFPQPLSEEAESTQIEAMAKGDREARNTLIEHNLRLVAHIVKKFEGANHDPDDLISIGTIGLIKGINTYDRSKGTKLATYAARCIENEILMHLRASKKLRSEVSLYDAIGSDKEGNEVTLLDILGTDHDVVVEDVENLMEQRRVLEQVKKLELRERQVLEWRYGLFNGLRRTQREIAGRMGISRSYVSRIEKKALQKLLKEISARS